MSYRPPGVRPTGSAIARPLVRPVRTGGYLAVEGRTRARRVLSAGGLARRRWLIIASKFLLPLAALLLLSSIALWPELERTTDKARVAMRGLGTSVEGGRITNAHYNGMDQHGRPFTVTAATAIQHSSDRIDLTTPNADLTLENGSWINVRSEQGVYTRAAQTLDLSGKVTLYRDDGMTLVTSSATVLIKEGAASSGEPTHVEGPLGVLDATGFTTVEKGAAIQFWGPARAVLNAASP